MPEKEEAPPSCPIDPSARAAWLEKAKQTGEAPPHPSPVPSSQQTPRLLKSRPLSQDREVSSIPRADPTLTTTTPNPSSTPSPAAQTPLPNPPSSHPLNSEHDSPPDPKSGNWIYPSEKMFFDAMRRKNYDPQATDMASIVPIHNAVNERAWTEIKKWESRFSWSRAANTQCGGPRLHSFSGDAKRLSPRARWNMLWGYREPFDRHDWVVQRCAGERGVEYVIDFYEGRAKGGKKGKMLNFYLDVRPKLNTWEGWRMRAASWTGMW